MKKSVNFSENNKIYFLYLWDYAYRQARKSDYQTQYLDRLRFEKRIETCETIFNKILAVSYRNKIFNERFNKENSLVSMCFIFK